MKVTKLRFQSTKRTEFSDWLRGEIDGVETAAVVWDPSEDHIRVMDIDWVIWKKEDNDYGDGPFMFIEEKQYFGKIKHDQAFFMKKLDNSLSITDPYYFHGYHLLQFENTHPENGDIILNGNWISTAEFMKFWTFCWPKEKYVSWHQKMKNDGVHWKQSQMLYGN